MQGERLMEANQPSETLHKESADAENKSKEVLDNTVPQPYTQNIDTIDSLNPASGDEHGEQCLACKMKSVPTTFIYALGRVSYIYPNDSVKNEVNQARFRADIPADMWESEALAKLLSDDNKSEFYYLATKLCWIFTLDRMEVYILIPSTATLLDGLINTLTSAARDFRKKLIQEPTVDLIIGKKGPISPPGMCGNLVLPLADLDQVSTYKVQDIVKRIKQEWNNKLGVPKDSFEKYIDNIFEKMLEAAHNEGATDEQRAVNYLIIRASSIYIESAKLQHRSLMLENISSLPVKDVGTRKIAEVVFDYRSKLPGGLLERYSIKVDVTGQFPFLVSGFSSYYSL